MKKSITTLFFATLLLPFSVTAKTQTAQSTITSFTHLSDIVTMLGDPAQTIVVMDDDDTLTMMPCDLSAPLARCQYLGGPAWFSWQSSLLTKKRKHKYRVAGTEEELLSIASLLLSITNMNYTEAVIPGVLDELTQKGVRLMVETARGNSDVASTDHQFSELSVSNDGNAIIDFANLIQVNAPVFKQGNIASLASPFDSCATSEVTRSITYRQGVVYVSGQNKGVILKCLIDRYNSEISASDSVMKIKNIIFIDDTLANVTDVFKAFDGNTTFNVQALHYTALTKHKANLVSGKNKCKFQSKANDRWLRIKDALNSNLLTPSY